jgi:hypothetical protein
MTSKYLIYIQPTFQLASETPVGISKPYHSRTCIQMSPVMSLNAELRLGGMFSSRNWANRHQTWLSSEMLRRVVWYIVIDISEVLTVSIISRALLTHCPDKGSSNHLWNIGLYIPDYTAQHPRWQPSLYSSPWERTVAIDQTQAATSELCVYLSVPRFKIHTYTYIRIYIIISVRDWH